MHALRSLSVFLCAAVIAAGIAAPAGAVAKKPIDYTAYDGWNAIRDVRLSDDGTYLAYTLMPEDGDSALVVRNLASGAETRQPHGTNAHFTSDAKFVVFTIAPLKRDVDAARQAKKPDDQMPKSGLGILELATGALVSYDRIKSVQVARDGARFVAFSAEPTPKPSPSAAPSAAASAMPATPAPKADKKKDDGTDLTIRDLQSNSNVVVHDVTDYVLADDGRTIAYATQSGNGDGNALHVRDLVAGTVTDVLAGNGRYKNLAVAQNGSMLGFLSDTRSYAQDVPHYDVYLVPLKPPYAAKRVVDETTASLPRGRMPSDNGTLHFTKDGRALSLGTAAAPTPLPSGTPVPIAVDLWTSKDLVLQSAQMHDAASERKRTYLGVVDTATGHFAQLGTPSMKTVVTNENPHVALGFDERPYAIESSWKGELARDMYAVSLGDGSRRLLARKTIYDELSPDGRYALTWDQAARHWVSLRTRDGKRTVLAPAAKVAFYDETDDHPAPPPPVGTGPWLAADRGVIIYDRYDPWLVDPATGTAVNLTHGAGRATKVAYTVVKDAGLDALPIGAPYLLTLSDQRTYASGFASLPFGGGTPRTLLRLDKSVNFANAFLGTTHQRIAPPLKARHANRVVFTEETYREYRDLWSSDLAFAAPRKVSNANPQLAQYAWGNESLISYTSDAGVPLRAVLLTPDGFDPHKKYPMLVYFYERWSDQYHEFYAPAPRYPTISRYVSNGYVVLLPDVVYTNGHPGRSALRCILAGVDAVSKRGFIDQKRIGIAGHSWAAYQINYLITQTDRFRAVEAGAAVANMTSAYGGIRLESGNVREGQYEVGQSRIGATPWDRPDLYLENSGLFHIRNIHTPYLTMHNDLDNAVPFEQGVEFITAMRRLGKPAYMFSFNGKEHNLRDVPADREQLKFFAVAVDEWFDYWLKGAPRPSWFDGVDYLHRGERNVRPLYGETEPAPATTSAPIR